MATPDYDQYVSEIFGWGIEVGFAYPSWGLLAAANIAVGENPPYDSADFLAIYPQFTSVPDAVIEAYLYVASISIMHARWFGMWKMAMGLYIAHYVTLWAQASALGATSTVQQAAAAGLAIGITTSKAVHDVSVGSTPITGLENWGSYQLTIYGQQFATFAKAIGSGMAVIY
jgi:hypothetical protein